MVKAKSKRTGTRTKLDECITERLKDRHGSQ